MKNLPWISALILGTFVALTAAGCQQAVKRVLPSNNAAQNTAAQENVVANTATITNTDGEQGDGGMEKERYRSALGFSVIIPKGFQLGSEEGNSVWFEHIDKSTDNSETPSPRIVKVENTSIEKEIAEISDDPLNATISRKEGKIGELSFTEVIHRTAFGIDNVDTYLAHNSDVFVLTHAAHYESDAYDTLRDSFRFE